MRVSRFPVAALALVSLLGACDDDPSRPSVDFRVTGCPTIGSVEAPIAIAFSGPLSPSSASGGNVIVSYAETGVEVPGSISVDPVSSTIVFSPAQPLPYDTDVRVRVQNVLDVDNRNVAPLFVCDITTPLPPITQLFWRQLPPPSGDALVSGSLPSDDVGFVVAERVAMFRRDGSDDFRSIFEQPYYSRSFDIAFLDEMRGYGAHLDFRVNRGVITRTLNGGATFDTIFTMDQSVSRLYMREYSPATIFGVVGGGTAVNARFVKYNSGAGTFSIVQNFGFTGAVTDIDFETDTTRTGAATTDGTKAGVFFQPGTVFFTDDGGATWTEVAGVRAGSPGVVSAVDYFGVSVRSNTEIWVTGSNGYVLKLTRAGANYTFQRVLTSLVSNPDSTTQEGLIYHDVEFAPDNPNKGWLVGGQLVGIVNGVPKYQGFIFETNDGGNTWTRQGVVDAPAFGGEIPRLRRIIARSSTRVWIVGDGGFVIDYAGTNP